MDPVAWAAGTALAALIQIQGEPLAAGRFNGSVRLPLERASGGDTPVLPFSSPAGPLRLLLDTGASSAMVTPAAAARLGLNSRSLPPQAFALAGGGTECGATQPRRAALPPLTLTGEGEGVRLLGAETLVLEVAALPPGVDGVLGIPALRQLPIRVDPPGQGLSLGHLALQSGTAPAPTQRLPLSWRRGVPVLNLVGASGSVPALADTGAEGLFISPQLASTLKPVGPETPLRLVGVCGEQRVQRRTYTGLGLAGHSQGAMQVPVEAIVTDNPIFAAIGVKAILGQELLRQRVQLWRLDAQRPYLTLW
jgi:hypothetical protein